MLCEVCGEKGATSKSKVDGLQLAVCSDCAKFGFEVQRVTETRPKKVVNSKMESDILPNYAEKLRRARENKGLSLEELANSIFEKRSVVEKVESGKMLPNDKLTKKLEKFFGIKIKGYVDSSHEGLSHNMPKATLGDIATIKKV